MLRRVALLGTDVSEERIITIIRVTRIGELGTTLAITSVLTRATRRHIPEDGFRHSRPSDNLKSYIVLKIVFAFFDLGLFLR
jgi:hypothetical protein